MNLNPSTNTFLSMNGLILSGGKSSRMGEDKSTLNYHGKAQSEYEADMIANFCDQVFISVAAMDRSNKSKYESLPDLELERGPMLGVASAFNKDPKVAWLVLACDLPYLNLETIQVLVKRRNQKKAATCFYNPLIKSPEPLIAIYEPSVLPVINSFMQNKNYSLRKLLLSIDVELLVLENEIYLKNSNTPAEKDEAMRFINYERR